MLATAHIRSVLKGTTCGDVVVPVSGLLVSFDNLRAFVVTLVSEGFFRHFAGRPAVVGCKRAGAQQGSAVAQGLLAYRMAEGRDRFDGADRCCYTACHDRACLRRVCSGETAVGCG